VKKILTAAVGDPARLAELLSARLKLSQAGARALVAQGSVHVDGKRARDATATVAVGMKLVVFVDDTAGSKVALPFEVRYVDDWFLVVDKPAGMVSQATRADEAGSLDALVRSRHPTARLLHRLDRDASGLVLFALSEAARAPLQTALEAHQIERRYLAFAAGRLDGEGRVSLRIARDPADPRRRIPLPEHADGGQAAASRWRVVGHGPQSTALSLELETGRTHQLRVHLAAIGHPLVGDRLYGSGRAEALHTRLCLHATELIVPHPQTGKRVVVSSPSPLPTEPP